MIYKRYGGNYHKVDPNFDSKALNEIGFRKDGEAVATLDEFEAQYRRLVGHELVAEAEGRVQDHTEQLLLDRLGAKLLELEASLDVHAVLVIESDTGPDWPKTRQQVRSIVEEGENRLHFEYTVWPPLRVGIYLPNDH